MRVGDGKEAHSAGLRGKIHRGAHVMDEQRGSISRIGDINSAEATKSKWKSIRIKSSSTFPRGSDEDK